MHLSPFSGGADHAVVVLTPWNDDTRHASSTTR
jgi:hypothetical protein